ncbi:MAG TPA: tocopherol cyclase family protein [Candidatus Thermoplasmatota archaeon]
MRPGHYEVWYITLNHRASGSGFWIRYTLESPAPGRGPAHAQVWFAAFDARDPSRNLALHRTHAIAEMRSAAVPFEVRIGPAVLGHGFARGEVRGAGRAARWDLSWTPAERTLRHLPDVVYRTPFADTRVLSPNPDVAVSGAIEVDGRAFVLHGEPGGQTHLWGRKHAHAWAWGRCNAFEGRPGALLESLSARLRRAGILFPPVTLLTLRLDGEELRFTRLLDALRCRCRFGTARYAFRASRRDVRIAGEFTCRPQDMVLAEYTDPDGERAYCANTEVATLRVQVRRRTGGRWRDAAGLVAEGTAHFEVASRTPDPAVALRHLSL